MADVCLALNSYQEVGHAATSPLEPLGANDTTRAHVLQTDQKDYGANDAV